MEEGDIETTWVVSKVSGRSVAVTSSLIFYPNSTPGNRKEGSNSPRSRLHIHHVISTNQRSVAQHLMRCLQEESKKEACLYNLVHLQTGAGRACAAETVLGVGTHQSPSEFQLSLSPRLSQPLQLGMPVILSQQGNPLAEST